MTMKLITEEVSSAEYIIEEADNGKKNYKIRGIFMQADMKNRNGRVYPMETLQKEVNRYNREFVEAKRAFGELGHPDGPTVNLERVSHMITSLTPEGKNFIGEAKIMDTPYGKIVKNLIDEGAKLGVSSRGMGSLENKGGSNYVKSDFYLATAADSRRSVCSRSFCTRHYGRQRVDMGQLCNTRSRYTRNEKYN